MSGGKRHIGLAGYPPRITDEDVPLPLEDHQRESNYPPQDAEDYIRDPREVKAPAGASRMTKDEPPWRAEMTHMSVSIGKELDTLRALSQASDPQFARSLLDFNERLTRIEKQIAFMSSAQAMQEKQMSLHKRATALDLAIKACGSDVTAGDLTGTADAFVIWLEAGVLG